MADRLPQLITVMAKNILPTEEKPHYYYFRVLVTPRTLGDHCTIKYTLLMTVPLNDVNVAFFREFYSTKVYSDDLEQYNIERIKDAYPKLYTLLMMSAEDAALEYYVSEAFINGELHIDSKLREKFESDVRYGEFTPKGDENIEDLPARQRTAKVKEYLHDEEVYEEWYEWELDNCADPEHLIEYYGADEEVEISEDDFACFIPEEFIR